MAVVRPTRCSAVFFQEVSHTAYSNPLKTRLPCCHHTNRLTTFHKADGTKAKIDRSPLGDSHSHHSYIYIYNIYTGASCIEGQFSAFWPRCGCWGADLPTPKHAAHVTMEASVSIRENVQIADAWGASCAVLHVVGSPNARDYKVEFVKIDTVASTVWKGPHLHSIYQN